MKKLLYILYLLIITSVFLEVGVRLLTKENPAHVELLMNKKHRYLLPLPTEPAYFYEGSIQEGEDEGYRVFDDTLGWSHNSWGKSLHDFPCYANNLGMRIDSASYVAHIPAKRHYDILTIGNSFTHGDAVAAEDSWPYLLEKRTGKTVGNLGVGGYGLQQALLRLMYSGVTADTVLFGAIWGDFERAREPVYTFYQGGNKTRPMIDFKDNGKFELVNVPVKTPVEFYATKKAHTAPIYKHIPGFDETVFSEALWTKSYFLRLLFSFNHQKKYFRPKPIYLTDDAELTYCINVFKLFKSYCEANEMYPIVVLLDTGQNFRHKEEFNLENPWALTAQKLKEQDVDYVEFHHLLFNAFLKDRNAVIHPVENLHYSPAGNQLVTDALINELQISVVK